MSRAGILAKLMRSAMSVENFKVGTLEKWGFGNDWLESTRLALFAARLPVTVRQGEAGLPGTIHMQAESGLMASAETLKARR